MYTRTRVHVRVRVYCVVVRTASCIKTLARKTTRFAFEPSDGQDQEDVERSPPGQYCNSKRAPRLGRQATEAGPLTARHVERQPARSYLPEVWILWPVCVCIDTPWANQPTNDYAKSAMQYH